MQSVQKNFAPVVYWCLDSITRGFTNYPFRIVENTELCEGSDGGSIPPRDARITQDLLGCGVAVAQRALNSLV